MPDDEAQITGTFRDTHQLHRSGALSLASVWTTDQCSDECLSEPAFLQQHAAQRRDRIRRG